MRREVRRRRRTARRIEKAVRVLVETLGMTAADAAEFLAWQEARLRARLNGGRG